MNRRKLMKLAPVALAAGAVPAVGMSGEAVRPNETPVERVFREWQDANEKMEAIDRKAMLTDESLYDQWDALWDARWEVEQRLVATPCENVSDALMKIAAWTQFGKGDLEGESSHLTLLWDEARVLIGGAA